LIFERLSPSAQGEKSRLKLKMFPLETSLKFFKKFYRIDPQINLSFQ